MKLLLVDDEEELISTLAERLDMRGVQAECAFSGHEAIAKASRADFDVIVLDMKMAGLDGIATMEEIKKIKPKSRFIIMTGHGDEDDYHKGTEAGALFYLMKPVDIDELLASADRAVAGQAVK